MAPRLGTLPLSLRFILVGSCHCPNSPLFSPQFAPCLIAMAKKVSLAIVVLFVVSAFAVSGVYLRVYSKRGRAFSSPGSRLR